MNYHKQSAFLVYIYLDRESPAPAREAFTRVTKRSQRRAVEELLTGRHAHSSCIAACCVRARETVTNTPEFTVLRPWAGRAR
jgi:hypothetical protein